ncbi:MAG: hypothetical protein K2O04_02835 [Clostridiales bacterium]|nr:hypothetical protein [Clostridiales bacterium]
MEYLKSDKQSNDKRMEIIIDSIKKAAEAVHIAGAACKKSDTAYKALTLSNKKEMWDILQLYLREYKDFINKMTVFTGYYIYNVDRNFYEQCSIDDIRKQIENVIGFIYAKEALTSVAKENFKQCLKKILKATKLFTDKELAIL